MNDELRRLYEELETVSRHKSEFLANMSHELRTPAERDHRLLRALQLQPYGELNERQLGYVDDVLDAGRHLLSLINDILDLSRSRRGRWSSTSRRVAAGCARERTDDARRACGARRRGDHAPSSQRTSRPGRRAQLRQVVFNLLSNAVKFTPAGGHVDVSRRGRRCRHRRGHRYRARIAPEDETLIFDEFQQARGGSNGADGTGLGCARRRFIELHGGRLWVETARGSELALFRFHPAIDRCYDRRCRLARPDRRRQRAEQAARRGMCCRPRVQNGRGGERRRGRLGRAANLPDVILMDIRLPDMTGPRRPGGSRTTADRACPDRCLTSLAMRAIRARSSPPLRRYLESRSGVGSSPGRWVLLQRRDTGLSAI